MKNNNYFKLEQKFETITGLKNILTIAQWEGLLQSDLRSENNSYI